MPGTTWPVCARTGPPRNSCVYSLYPMVLSSVARSTPPLRDTAGGRHARSLMSHAFATGEPTRAHTVAGVGPGDRLIKPRPDQPGARSGRVDPVTPVLRRCRHGHRATRAGVFGDVGRVRHAAGRYAKHGRRRTGRPMCDAALSAASRLPLRGGVSRVLLRIRERRPVAAVSCAARATHLSSERLSGLSSGKIGRAHV